MQTTTLPPASPAANPTRRSRLQQIRDSLLLQEDLNFLFTNRLPRVFATRLMGRFSKIRSRTLTRLTLALWRAFTDLDLREARQRDFMSLHECFTRELVPGARPIDPAADIIVSPCDAIIGACGPIAGQTVFQAKGFPYQTTELFGHPDAAAPFRDGCYVTLRLTSTMYHRFHAPMDATVEHVTYLSGDTWNVNPIALKRVEKLFCKNERVVLRLRAPNGQPFALVAVAAILVASVRLHFLDVLFHLRWPGPNEIPCKHPARCGEELGWFEHGSTIIVFAPPGYALCPGLAAGQRIKMGERLLHAI